MQFIAAYVMKGRLQAMTIASTLALLSLIIPPISIVSSAAVALVTLRQGAKEGVYVLISACLAVALLSILLLGGYQFALIYGLVLWLPVWLIAMVLRETGLLNIALEVSVLLGIVMVVGFFWYEPEPAAIWNSLLSLFIQQMIEAQPDVPEGVVKSSAETFAHYMTGAVAAGSLYGVLFSLFLARWWQAKLFNPGGFRVEYLALKGHKQLAVVTVALIILAAMASGITSEICWNVLLVLLVFYSITGLAVLHSVFTSIKGSRYSVPILYVTLVAMPHLMALIALCGLSDSWLNLRNKIKPNGTQLP